MRSFIIQMPWCYFCNNLTWSVDISNITNTASRALGYLHRNLCLVPPSVKLLAYLTLIRPKLEYASSVWDSHQTNLSSALESIQNRAARFVHSDYSYHTSVTELKSSLHFQPLSNAAKLQDYVCFISSITFYVVRPTSNPYIVLHPVLTTQKQFIPQEPALPPT